MTHVFVLTNHKGGVGKSTSATNIALGLTTVLSSAGVANPRVLLIDTDSQGHASLVTTGRNDFGADDSLYTVLMADRKDAPQTLINCIAPSTWSNDLHVLPASPLLDGAIQTSSRGLHVFHYQYNGKYPSRNRRIDRNGQQ